MPSSLQTSRERPVRGLSRPPCRFVSARPFPIFVPLLGLALVLPGALRRDVLAAQDGPAPAASPASPAPEPKSVEDFVKQGNEARRAGQSRQAIASYRKARDLSPRTYEIRLLLADTLRRTGDSGRAMPEYEAGLRIDPARFEAYAGKALILRSRYDYEGAAALLQQGLAMVPSASRPDLLLVLAETRRRQGRLDDAARLLAEIRESRAKDASARAGLARVAEDRGDLEGAIRAWELYLELKPDDEAASLRRQELRELRASIEALRQTAERAPAAPVLAELGRLWLVAGDARASAAAYRRALRIDPGAIETRRGLALALRDGGREQAPDALREFGRVLAKRPGDAVALYALLALAVAAGDAREEGDAWRALVAARPDDLFALRGEAAFLERQGRPAVERAIERARLDAGGAASPAGLRRLALLMATAGRFAEASEVLYRVLLLDPTDPWSLEVANDLLFLDPGILTALADRLQADAGGGPGVLRQTLLARLIWWSGRGGEALVMLRQAAAAHPESSVIHSALAEAFQEIARRTDLALAEIAQAVRLDPTRPAAHVDLALTLLRLGRSREAAGAARRCLESAPETAPALSVLGAALADTGDYEGAASAYAAALVADPADNFGLARGQLPTALAALGRNVEARRALRGQSPPIPEMLYREAWAFARDASRDRAFNGQDWLAWRTRYQGTLKSENDAYAAISVMLTSLGDPYTRLRDPEETAALYLARHGTSAGIDALGRASLSGATVVTGDLPGGLGYIRLSNFTDPSVVAQVRAALEAMRRKEGIVLDLRGNPGGLSRAADQIGDLLVGPGRETGVDATPGGPAPQVTGGEGALTDGPITVLVDGQTGSAAERLARALAGTGRASLAGDATFGKGRAQMSRVLPGGTTVLVSASEMLGPDGRPLQGRGLEPKNRLPPGTPPAAQATPRP